MLIADSHGDRPSASGSHVGVQWRFRQRAFRILLDQNAPRAGPISGQDGVAERWIWLRLKLIADAGLVRPAQCRQIDFPRHRFTGGEAEDADYPFTTLHPGSAWLRIDAVESVLRGGGVGPIIPGSDRGRGMRGVGAAATASSPMSSACRVIPASR